LCFRGNFCDILQSVGEYDGVWPRATKCQLLQRSPMDWPQTIAIKIGTSSLTTDCGQLALSTLATLVEVIVRLRQQGCQVLLVSSGAVGVGRVRLGLTERPQTLAAKQAVAAVGQSRLMRVYDDLFANLQ